LNKIKTKLKITNMKVNLTQKEIDIIYFRLKDYIKISNNVDYLKELTEVDNEEFKVELELIEKFSKL
jgi:hypothetical protein